MVDAIQKFEEILKDVDELSSVSSSENAEDYLSLDSDSDEENGQETLKVPESSK